MKIIEANIVNEVLDFGTLIAALRASFAQSFTMPQRRVFALEEGQAHSDAFALLPAWNNDAIAVKAFTYFPHNPDKGYETLYSKIMLFSRKNGQPLALVDGTSITYWRTAAVSALAADYLARKDAKKLLICGTGKLAPFMALAHASIRPIEEIAIWGRSHDKALALVEKLITHYPALNIRVADDLQLEAGEADIISCATGAGEPVILGDWVQAGTHTDFVGNHERSRRECDSNLVVKACLFVDSRINVLAEAGEILLPMEEGLINEQNIQAELAELCRGAHAGRAHADEITLFKSVGTALSDLAAALLVYNKLSSV